MSTYMLVCVFVYACVCVCLCMLVCVYVHITIEVVALFKVHLLIFQILKIKKKLLKNLKLLWKKTKMVGTTANKKKSLTFLFRIRLTKLIFMIII